MNRLVKIFIIMIVISTISILYYSDEFKYEQSILNLERGPNSQEMIISSSYADQENVYQDIATLLEKYNGNLFYTFDKTIDNRIYHTKYVYLTDQEYEKKSNCKKVDFLIKRNSIVENIFLLLKCTMTYKSENYWALESIII